MAGVMRLFGGAADVARVEKGRCGQNPLVCQIRVQG
jgi:hypothetical protein